MPEKSSMMAHSDVFLTVYSTMVVEAACHGAPIISACLDTPGGWNRLRKFSLPLSEIGNWPTHDRFRRANAGRVAYNADELRQAIDYYLQDPTVDREAREAFIRRECTYTDGSAGKRTGEYLLQLINNRIA
jgi:CDP-glycerol glycerophosphotransferase (TagB/SpsB family)